MRYKISVSLHFLALLFVVGTCLSIAAGWQWIKPQQVYSLLKEGSGLWLVDLRGETAFTEGHMEGALHLPAGALDTKRLPLGKIIVLVDDSLGLRAGRKAADDLLKKGHDKVFLLEGGMRGWQGEGYPVAGKGRGGTFLSVRPDDVEWALENRIPLRIFDLRDRKQQAQGKVRQAVEVEGKNFAAKLERVRMVVAGENKKRLSAKLEKPLTTILVIPVGIDPLPVLERTFTGEVGDVRFLDGGYVAWAAKPGKDLNNTAGVCPSCP